MTATAIATALGERLGLDVVGIELTAGGDINDAYRAETADGRVVFVKSSSAALPGVFADEAAGLVWLGEPNGAVATANVIGVVDDPDPQLPIPRLLALDWIERGQLDAAGEQSLGRGLAAMHAAGAPEFGATPVIGADGLIDQSARAHAPMRFNELALPNDPCGTWAEFYARRRIEPLTRECVDRGLLDSSDAEILGSLVARIDALAGPAEPVARTHGDLWSGNVLTDSTGTPHLIDPVAHGGHREVDLALLRVFGGPGERCFDAYDEAFPLAEGWRERIELWQLAMILLHVYLFGGSYRSQALAIARRYV
ncbi:MAG: fructosamine kinase family protein [Solirubrobacterales bacterium]